MTLGRLHGATLKIRSKVSGSPLKSAAKMHLYLVTVMMPQPLLLLDCEGVVGLVFLDEPWVQETRGSWPDPAGEGVLPGEVEPLTVSGLLLHWRVGDVEGVIRGERDLQR